MLDRTGAIVVLCSSWKHEWERDEEKTSETGKYLERKLKRQGIHISGKTGDGDGRGKEIIEWLVHNSGGLLEGWCVLDDEVAPDYETEGILPHLVKTCKLSGLTENDVDRAAAVLNMNDMKDVYVEGITEFGLK